VQALQPSAGLIHNRIILGKAETGQIFPAVVMVEGLSGHTGNACFPKQVHGPILAVFPGQPADVGQDIVSPLRNIGTEKPGAVPPFFMAGSFSLWRFLFLR
jgi:hypothetical protein